MRCHKFGENLWSHTNHDDRLMLQCFDCHKKVEVTTEEEEEDNVHSVSYFLVHKKTCYDKDFSKACLSCHKTWTVDKAKEWLSTWRGRGPVHD